MSSDGIVRSVDPAAPDRTVFEGPAADDVTVDRAVAAARVAQRAWGAAPARDRGEAIGRIADLLQQQADHMVDLLVTEVGKPLREARGEVARGVAICRYFSQIVLASQGEEFPAGEAGQWLLVRRRPRGVCGLITPWNLPVAISLWKAIPALAYGNAVVLKPAPASAATVEALAALMNRSLPQDLLWVVQGDRWTGAALIDNPGVDAVSFTGSVAVGRVVAAQAARRGIAAQCEMGGQNPAVVLADADLDAAARMIAYSAMGAAGQKCTATRRVIVDRKVLPELRDRLVAEIEALVVPEPRSEECQVGPMIDGGSRAAAQSAIRAAGGRVLTGGVAPELPGFYLEPTLVELDAPTGVLATEEVFAPVTALIPADSVDDALAIADDVRFGLIASLHTTDLASAMRAVETLSAGLVRINAPTAGLDVHVPFGGTKESSYGPREQGLAARDFFTQTVTVTLNGGYRS